MFIYDLPDNKGNEVDVARVHISNDGTPLQRYEDNFLAVFVASGDKYSAHLWYSENDSLCA